MIEGIDVNELKIIPNEKGDILHALKSSDPSFISFGEVYISSILKNQIKGWKKHKTMVSNLIVPYGKIRLVFFDNRIESQTRNEVNIFDLSINNYKRITIKPNIWFAFEGLEEYNLLLNIANILHDPLESENLSLENELFSYSKLVNK